MVIPAVTVVNGAGRGRMQLGPDETSWALERMVLKTEVRDECWWWTGYLRSGYGSLSVRDSEVHIHRLACAIAHGPPPDGQEVLHACDNRPCWRPTHLRYGTHQANVRDAIEKGRNSDPPRAMGIDNCKAHLSDADVAEIRRMWTEKVADQRGIAAAFGCSQSTVWRYIHEKVRA